jgi:hypothetical protein
LHAECYRLLTITNGTNSITVTAADVQNIYALAWRAAQGEFNTKSVSGTLTASSNQMTGIASTAGLSLGMVVKASIAGLAAGTTITAIGPTTLP